MPIFYDVEDGSLNGLSKETLTTIVKEFCQRIEEGGYQAGVYANKNWLNHKLNVDELKDYVIWAAVYGNNDGNVPADSVKYTGEHAIWQYTSRGYVEGINGRVDKNIMYEDIMVDNQEPVVQEPTPVFTGDDNMREIQHTLNERYGIGLEEDGYYGPKTKAGLIKALQTEVNVRLGAKGKLTYILQAILYAKGYNTNGIEGIFGKGTASAVRKFQSDNGLSADGVVGKNTFEKLFY